MLRHIVIPLDGSKHAEKALAYAIDIARDHGADLSLVVVVPSYEMMTGPAARLPGAKELENHHRELAQDYLDTQVAILTASGLPNVQGVLRRGDIRQEINDFAQLTGADLIIVSTHGLSAAAAGEETARVMGSTALRILMTAPCPVLLVRDSIPERPASMRTALVGAKAV